MGVNPKHGSWYKFGMLDQKDSFATFDLERAHKGFQTLNASSESSLANPKNAYPSTKMHS